MHDARSSPGSRAAYSVDDELGPRRIDFRNDGSGTVQMLDSTGWLPIETSWIAGPALCWNGLCAQGDIPLD